MSDVLSFVISVSAVLSNTIVPLPKSNDNSSRVAILSGSTVAEFFSVENETFFFSPSAAVTARSLIIRVSAVSKDVAVVPLAISFASTSTSNDLVVIL